MALGLRGARGERHVHRRRSACDRAAFLWGLAQTQAGAGEGKGLGVGDCGAVGVGGLKRKS